MTSKVPGLAVLAVVLAPAAALASDCGTLAGKMSLAVSSETVVASVTGKVLKNCAYLAKDGKSLGGAGLFSTYTKRKQYWDSPLRPILGEGTGGWSLEPHVSSETVLSAHVSAAGDLWWQEQYKYGEDGEVGRMISVNRIFRARGPAVALVTEKKGFEMGDGGDYFSQDFYLIADKGRIGLVQKDEESVLGSSGTATTVTFMFSGDSLVQVSSTSTVIPIDIGGSE